LAPPSLITDGHALARLVDRLDDVDRYALDTEFHRERTYWPHLALVQLAWPEGPGEPSAVALIDPLSVDIRPLSGLLSTSATMVAHAAEQDLEVLDRACGRVPQRLFDTQVAAGFLGHGSASLSALTSQFLGVRLRKGDRLTDWSNRPLTEGQLTYAVADVAHLLDLADVLTAELNEAGRLAWAEEECEELRRRPAGPVAPDRAWWKLRDARQLRGSARGVAQEVAAWREWRAREIDQPARFVLPDLAVQAIAHGQPTTVAALRQMRGLDSRHLRGSIPAHILAAIGRGQALPEEALQLPPAEEVDRDMRPAVALAAAWVAQLARDWRIDAALLATRADLVSYLRGDETSRLAEGWRATLLGQPLGRLMGGEAALAFNGRGRLVLEARSHRPIDPAS